MAVPIGNILEQRIMPVYDYVCGKCGASEELFISFKDAETKKFKCEACGGTMKRVFSLTADTRSRESGGFAPAPACEGSGG